uniref:Methyltransferase TARBP1 n=1 Tax=Ascaris suum TaxID=6253 RepID=F1KRS2_ASCSU
MDLGLDVDAKAQSDCPNFPIAKMHADSLVSMVRKKVNMALDEKDWTFFGNLGEHCKTAEEALALLQIVETADKDEMDTVCLILLSVGGRGWPEVDEKVKELATPLMNFPSSRLVRKVAAAALRSVVSTDSCPLWNEYFVLLNALEESQYHLIQPALPKFDVLLKAFGNPTGDGFIPPRWMYVLFFKAANHPNGWIRLWTVEKLLTVSPHVFGYDPSTILLLLLPALNSTDLFARLIETKEMEDFLNNFSRFLNRITICDEILGPFYKTLLDIFTTTWNPCSLYLLSTALVRLNAFPAFAEESFPLFRLILANIDQIQHTSLKLCTSVNFMIVFINLTCWSETTIWAFVPLLNGFSSRAFNAAVKQAFISIFLDPLQTMMPEYSAYSLQITYLSYCNEHVDSVHWYAIMTWIIAEVQGIRDELFKMVCDTFVQESQFPVQNFQQLDALLHLWVEGDYRESAQSFYGIVMQYLETRLLALEGKREDFDLFNSLLKRLMIICMGRAADRSVPIQWSIGVLLTTEEEGTLMKHAMLLAIANVQLLTVQDKSENVEEAVENYFTRNVFLPTNCSEFDEGMCEADTRFAKEMLTTSRLQLALHYFSVANKSPKNLLLECIEDLSQSLRWEHRDAIASLIIKLLPEVKGTDERLKAIDALIAMVKEAKGTRYYVPSVNALLNACMQKEMIIDTIIAKKIREVLSELIGNAEVAYTICAAIGPVMWLLNAEWAPLLVDLCWYGSTSKKNRVLLDYASQMAYSSRLSCLLSKLPTDMHHTLMQRTRLEALLMTYQICATRTDYGNTIVKRIIEMSTLLDKDRCKSFALSLPHRQQTRLMQLLLLILDTLDKASIGEVLAYCELFLTDQAQQPSTRLLVELILVRIFIYHNEAFDHFIEMERDLARTRIGSVSSWINIIMHVAKVKNSQELFERCFMLFLPWCTAQNFSVRCSAIAAIKCLWPLANEETQAKLPWLQKVTQFNAESNGNARRIIENLCDDFYFGHFHAENHFTLQTILETFPVKTGMPYDETIPVSICRSHSGSSPIRSVCFDEEFNNSPSLIYSGPVKQFGQRDRVDEDDDTVEEADEPLQRKLNVFRGKWKRPEGTSLIVVATLVKKPANLGGLCRTSEIFGAEKLVLANSRIVEDRTFKSLSLSSENWIEIEQVTACELLDYLDKMRKMGYKIIAAEQTTNSKSFAMFRFPRKCVLLLGDEKEGIPVEYIRYVDHSVEIAQVGQTRSLNVHVTGALFIHKFAEDNYFK